MPRRNYELPLHLRQPNYVTGLPYWDMMRMVSMLRFVKGPTN